MNVSVMFVFSCEMFTFYNNSDFFNSICMTDNNDYCANWFCTSRTYNMQSLTIV